jgi:hypothetical protein
MKIEEDLKKIEGFALTLIDRALAVWPILF